MINLNWYLCFFVPTAGVHGFVRRYHVENENSWIDSGLPGLPTGAATDNEFSYSLLFMFLNRRKRCDCRKNKMFMYNKAFRIFAF